MRITALSDLHGYLPVLKDTDLVVITGDFSPVKIQTDRRLMEEWIKSDFIPWLKSTKANKIIFIAGNHDFICEPTTWNLGDRVYEYDFKFDFLIPLLKEHKLIEKVEYLCNEFCFYKDYKIYGCPYVDGLTGWAFSDSEKFNGYSNIKKCDILLTHQPPDIGGLGSTRIKKDNFYKDMEFGSKLLLQKIKSIKPKLLFCGHIHNGNHNEVIIEHSNKKITKCYNVSLKNENYDIAYEPLTVEFF